MQIRSKKLQQVLIILMTKALLPNDIKELNRIYMEFSELFSWKVMNKADELGKSRLN